MAIGEVALIYGTWEYSIYTLTIESILAIATATIFYIYYSKTGDTE